MQGRRALKNRGASLAVGSYLQRGSAPPPPGKIYMPGSCDVYEYVDAIRPEYNHIRFRRITDDTNDPCSHNACQSPPLPVTNDRGRLGVGFDLSTSGSLGSFDVGQVVTWEVVVVEKDMRH